MMYAAQPFAFWRGMITYRFEIVCSAFHRGKIGVYYEPNIYHNNIISSTTFMNKQAIKLVDIQDTQTFEICVDWASYRDWLKAPQTIATYKKAYSTTANQLDVTTTGCYNGFLSVFVFTELQAPDDAAISINVYAKCDDLQVAVPYDNLVPAHRTILTSSSCNIGVPITCTDINPTSADNTHIAMNHFGEQVLSYRALVKRFVGSQNIVPGSATDSFYSVTNQILPVNNLPYATTSAFPTSQAHDYFSYLRYAFLGIRGSIRVRVRFKITNTGFNQQWIKANLLTPSTSFTNTTSHDTTSFNQAQPMGSVTFCPSTNAGIEFELPYMSNNLFQYCFADSYDDSSTTNDNMESMWLRNYWVTYDTLAGSSIGSVPCFDIEKAAGEDFSMMRFQGAPFFTSA